MRSEMLGMSCNMYVGEVMAELENTGCGVEGGATVAAIVETKTTDGEAQVTEAEAEIAVTVVFTAETAEATD